MTAPTYMYSDMAIQDGMTAILNAHNQIDTRLDELERFASGQLATWESDTREDYNTHKRGWEAGVNKMKSIMVDNAVPALDRILTNYNLTEAFNKKKWQDG